MESEKKPTRAVEIFFQAASIEKKGNSTKGGDHDSRTKTIVVKENESSNIDAESQTHMMLWRTQSIELNHHESDIE